MASALPLASTPDPLCNVVARGFAVGNARKRPTQQIRNGAREIRDRARAMDNRKVAIAELDGFVSDYQCVEINQ
jgi:hypothetical protein